ncbi:hypothetical protein AAX26_01373 [Aliarcobacter thereius]|uniref:Uncharacterized protein n=1 Tax=Aliarcobacter thereius LMG 24486 TaxID=1032240 RepID=A0A1C7WRL7_9BACT|nr:hypothetical protein [Aliarcobacter thereius]OCL87065.1 hypothetical protein AAX26_01373 [Aliarcobacter thereius]OCL95914.1 hypothetical protein AA347_01403 [Aliarcobacter thereius LMG 24486]QBF16113.1 hypothetical protein ATH_1047 [Aliarcobacter thereius LMG 24486]TLS94549.1 hypothetical protein FE244_00260 [Aliarcobacter thereius]
MKIIGDSLIPFEEFYIVNNIEDISKTRANSQIFFNFDEKLLKYSFEQSLNFFVEVKSVKEAIYSNSLNARYIVCDKILARKLQKIADNYIFDSKILALISSNEEFEDIAEAEIDGVIYEKTIKERI